MKERKKYRKEREGRRDGKKQKYRKESGYIDISVKIAWPREKKINENKKTLMSK